MGSSSHTHGMPGWSRLTKHKNRRVTTINNLAHWESSRLGSGAPNHKGPQDQAGVLTTTCRYNRHRHTMAAMEYVSTGQPGWRNGHTITPSSRHSQISTDMLKTSRCNPLPWGPRSLNGFCCHHSLHTSHPRRGPQAQAVANNP